MQAKMARCHFAWLPISFIIITVEKDTRAVSPRMWVLNSLDSENTTNACEAFHSKYNGRFNHFDPNIYVFIEVLKGIQEEVFISMRSA